MPKRRRTRHRPTPRQDRADPLRALARPGQSPAELAQTLRELGQQASEDFARDFAALQVRVRETDPLSLLGWFGFYHIISLTSQLGRADRRGRKPDAALGPHHLELVQALALQHAPAELGTQEMVPDRAGELGDLVQRVFRAAGTLGFGAIEPRMPLAARARQQVVAQMRLETQGTRGWGYPEQIAAIIGRLFAPLDDALAVACGVRVAALLAMCERLSALVAERCEAHIAALAPVFRAGTVEATVAAYYDAFPDLEGSPAEMLSVFAERGARREQMRWLLMAHADLRLADIFLFHRNDFVAAYEGPVEPGNVEAVLRRWSLAFGDLAGTEPHRFGLDSPVGRAPLIALDDGWFFLPIPTLLSTSALELMEAVVCGVPALRLRYEERRGRFLEEEIASQFAAALPGAMIHRGVMWDDPETKKRFENDLVVRCDTWVIAVEAKAGRIGAATRRGAEKSLRRDLGDLLVAPAAQSARLVDYLRSRPGPHRLTNKEGDEVALDTTGVRHYLQLSVTLDSLGLLTAHTPTLRDAGLVPDGTTPIPTMGLADLDTVLTLLRGPAERLHYLARRAQFERDAHYIADELDLLAFYLETGLALDREKTAETRFALYGLSERLHPYLMRQWTGVDAARPERPLAPLWWDVLACLEEERPPGWTEHALALLDVPHDAQVAFERDFARLRRRVRAGRAGVTGGRGTLIRYAGADRERVILGVAYRAGSLPERDDLLSCLANEGLVRAAIDEGLLLGIDVDRDPECHVRPYSVLAVVSAHPPGDSPPLRSSEVAADPSGR